MSVKVKVKIFGVAREITGGKEITIELNDGKVKDLRESLFKKYPALVDLHSILLAVNSVYAEDDQSLAETDEIALIPPVSGG